MPHFLSVPVKDVFLRTGTLREEAYLGTQLRPQRPWDVVPRYGLMLYWPRAAWLRVSLSGANFTDTRDGLAEVCKTHHVEPAQVAPGEFLQKFAVQIGSVARDVILSLACEVNTSHPEFAAAVRQGRDPKREEYVVTLQVRFFDAAALGSYFDQSGTVTLVLQPAKPAPPFDGFAALDLGNTSSTLAGLTKEAALHRTDSLRLLNADAPRGLFTAQAPPLPSQVRVDRIVSAQPGKGTRVFPNQSADDRPEAVDFVAGRLASATASPALVMGAKRLLAGKDWEKPVKVITRHFVESVRSETTEELELLSRLPGELLVCRLLERFRQAALAWPADIALTYPTTYTPRELSQLVSVVERGWLRMQGQPQGFTEQTGPGDDPEQMRVGDTLRQRLADTGGDEPGLVGLKIDEASAAAFFFLYRRVFESPGGLPRFRYLYPEGLNLLLYDCGGGTTDIALVRAHAPAADHLRVTVLARNGLRGFGGDDMTRAACRILKAKLQLELARLRNRPIKLNFPPKPAAGQSAKAALEELFAKLAEADPRDDLVPTRFDADRYDPGSQARRTQVLDLWRWGEELKTKLADAEEVPFYRIDRHTNALAAALLQGIADAQLPQAVNALGKVTLARWELDALIDEPIRRSVANCNRMIRRVLQEGCKPDEQEVHWVVASGNGARYPLIANALRGGLNVAFLPDRFLLDEDNLKHAVAKGAVMALATMRAVRSVRIEFDSELSERLPFDVGYHDLSRAAAKVLFAEHERYDRLTPQRVSLAVAAREVRPGSPQTFVLERRFPGDEAATPYLAFEFPEGVSGELEVSYDVKRHEFEVRDLAKNRAGTPRDLSEGGLAKAPVQRGDL